jgi:hypothetical protein
MINRLHKIPLNWFQLHIGITKLSLRLGELNEIGIVYLHIKHRIVVYATIVL